MIPLRDVVPSRTTPVITLALMGANLGVFIYELMLPGYALDHFFRAAGLVPAAFSWRTAFTAMFVHDGYLHIGGNLLTLWIFGDNVEDRMGHGRYLVFYLLVGLAGNLTQTWIDPASTVPLIGASGAIAGVMGAYFVLLPRSRILVLIIFFFFIDIVEIPAVFFLAFWFLMQLFGGVGQLTTSGVGGVGFWAHVGGFLSGVIGVWVFARPERRRMDWSSS